MGKFMNRFLVNKIMPIIKQVIIICFDIQLNERIDNYDEYEKKILEKLKNEDND